ncbi:MAG: cytochrome C [Planctomycetota bacterium]
MTRFLGTMFGPRVSPEELRANRLRYLAPTLFFMAARVLLIVSIFLPYWHMELDAPQYPNGLFLTAYVNHLAGDVKEIDGLNHYIGMRPLGDAAKYERAASIWAILAMFLLIEGAAFVHSRWAVALVLPAALFPVGFLVDLYYWMATFGQNLDPNAPLSASVKPFTPTLLGEGGLGQFKTYSEVGHGFWLATMCSVLIIVAVVFHRRAYKPLFEREFADRARAQTDALAAEAP